MLFRLINNTFSIKREPIKGSLFCIGCFILTTNNKLFKIQPCYGRTVIYSINQNLNDMSPLGQKGNKGQEMPKDPDKRDPNKINPTIGDPKVQEPKMSQEDEDFGVC